MLATTTDIYPLKNAVQLDFLEIVSDEITVAVAPAGDDVTMTRGQAVVTALASALDGGQLDSAAFNAAVQRVTALRAGLH